MSRSPKELISELQETAKGRFIAAWWSALTNSRVRQLRDEADGALAALDRIIDGQIRPLNQRLGLYPRIMVGSRGGTRPRATSGGRRAPL